MDVLVLVEHELFGMCLHSPIQYRYRVFTLEHSFYVVLTNNEIDLAIAVLLLFPKVDRYFVEYRQYSII